MTLDEVADEIVAAPHPHLPRGRGRAPAGLWRRRASTNDPAFRDDVLFYEYFHGDNGRGLGAAHQTGWTGLVALLLTPLPATASDPDAAMAEDRADAGR